MLIERGHAASSEALGREALVRACRVPGLPRRLFEGVARRMAGLIVADASALIAYLNPGDAHHADAVQGLIDVDQFVVHPVTLAEVLVHPAQRPGVDLVGPAFSGRA